MDKSFPGREGEDTQTGDVIPRNWGNLGKRSWTQESLDSDQTRQALLPDALAPSENCRGLETSFNTQSEHLHFFKDST